MAIIRFDQDPELPQGAGTFYGDDGSTFFAHDPDMANAVAQPTTKFTSSRGEEPPDERTAGYASFASADINALANEMAGGQRPLPAPTATDAPAPGVMGPPPPPAPAASPEQPVPMQQAPAGPPPQESPALGQAEALQSNVDAYANRPVYEAPRRGGVVPVTQSEVRESQGMPYDPNSPEAQQRAEASIGVNMAGSAKAQAEAARAQGEAAAYQAALPELQEQARVAQMRRDMQDRQYRRDRDDLDMAIQESDKSAKSFNANKWFDDRGAIGNIGAAIAQAFGAGAATLAGGPNVVLQQLNAYQDRDIANQRAQIEAGKENANSALARLNRQFGNLDQAEAALKIAQMKKTETMAQAYAASTKSEDIQNSLNMWLAENEQRRVAAEQQFQNAAYGKTALTTAAKVIPSTRGGMRDPTQAEVDKRYETLNKRNAVIGGTYEGEIKRQKAMGMDPEKKDKENVLLIENLDGSQVMAKKPEEAEKIRTSKALHTGAVRELQQIKKIAQESASGGRAGEAKGRIRVLMKRALERGNTMAGQGVFRTDDDAYYTDALFGAGGGVRTEVIDELVGTLDHEYQSLVDSQRGSAVKVAETGKGQQVQYTGRAAKRPTREGALSGYEVGKK